MTLNKSFVLPILVTASSLLISGCWVRCEGGTPGTEPTQTESNSAGGVLNGSVSMGGGGNGLLQAAFRRATEATGLSVASVSDFAISFGGNVVMYNQSASGTLFVKDGDNVVAAQTFPFSVQSGVATFDNPAAVESWLLGYNHLPDPEVEFVYDGLTFDGDFGQQVIEINVESSNQTLATSTVTRFVPPVGGGWCDPVTGICYDPQ